MALEYAAQLNSAILIREVHYGDCIERQLTTDTASDIIRRYRPRPIQHDPRGLIRFCMSEEWVIVAYLNKKAASKTLTKSLFEKYFHESGDPILPNAQKNQKTQRKTKIHKTAEIVKENSRTSGVVI